MTSDEPGGYSVIADPWTAAAVDVPPHGPVDLAGDPAVDSAVDPAGRAPRVSWEAATAVVVAAVVILVLGFDAALLGHTKHVVCDKWLAKGFADCASGDGFREWAPKVVRQLAVLVAVQVVALPAAAYLVGRFLRPRRDAATD